MSSSQIPKSNDKSDDDLPASESERTGEDPDDGQRHDDQSYGEGIFGQGHEHPAGQHGQGVFEQGHVEPEGQGVFEQGHPDPPEEGEGVYDQDRPDQED